MCKPLFFAASLCACLAIVPARASAGQEKKPKDFSSIFHNDRLKALSLPDRPITGDASYRVVSGFWVADTKDPSKTLVFPQQVRISCASYKKTCTEMSVTLAPTPISVSIQEIEDEEFDINTWDAHGLLASYGGDPSSKCQRHVLTMDFDTGAVSLSDIPTHQRGCEAFVETNSYRLVQGNYYIDTTPGNDADKPKK